MQNPLESIFTSTFYSPELSPNALMRSYQLTYPDGTVEEYLDLADWNYRAIIKGITVSVPYIYNGYEKFTTIMNNFYDNTTCYRIVLTFNGFMHPYEIDNGAVINLPDPSQLAGLIKQQQIKKRTSPITDVII